MIAILGCGRIGEALLTGLLGAGWTDIVVTSRTEERVAELRERHGVEATTDNVDAARRASCGVFGLCAYRRSRSHCCAHSADS